MASQDPNSQRSIWSKLFWFVGLWCAGVGTVLIIALIIRKMLGL